MPSSSEASSPMAAVGGARPSARSRSGGDAAGQAWRQQSPDQHHNLLMSSCCCLVWRSPALPPSAQRTLRCHTAYTSVAAHGVVLASDGGRAAAAACGFCPLWLSLKIDILPRRLMLHEMRAHSTHVHFGGFGAAMEADGERCVRPVRGGAAPRHRRMVQMRSGCVRVPACGAGCHGGAVTGRKHWQLAKPTKATLVALPACPRERPSQGG